MRKALVVFWHSFTDMSNKEKGFMCGRFANPHTREELSEAFDVSIPLSNSHPSPSLMPSWNIAPSMMLAAITHHGLGRRAQFMRWGLRAPQGEKLLINARCETMADKPTFRVSARSSRCILPAGGWFEWKAPKTPYYITRRDKKPMVFGGLYWPGLEQEPGPIREQGQRQKREQEQISEREEAWGSEREQEHVLKRESGWRPNRSQDRGEARCVIITAAAPRALTEIHHRTPLLIDEAHIDRWLDPNADEGEINAMLKPVLPDDLLWYRVSSEVGSNKANHEGLLSPLDSGEEGWHQPSLFG